MIKSLSMIIFKNLKQRKRRSWLTILGVVIGIAAIVSLITISQGLENAIKEQFSKMGTQTVLVVPKGYQGPMFGVEGLTQDDVDLIKKIRGVNYVTGTLTESDSVEFSKEERYLSVIGYSSDVIDKVFEDNDYKILEGRVIENNEKESIVIGNGVANDVFKKEVLLRSSILIKDEKFKVVGILEKTGLPAIDNQIFTSLDEARRLFNEPKEVNSITVHILDGVNADEVSKNIKSKLKRSRDAEDFEVYVPTEILAQLGSILGVLSIVLGGIASISLLVGGVGIMNSMYTSVLERTRQIGIMKAIGAKKNSILMIFLVEAGLIGLVGGLIGLSLGTALAYSVGFIAKTLGFPLLLIKAKVSVLIASMLFAFLVGLISGLLPAIRAANLIPVEALRYE